MSRGVSDGAASVCILGACHISINLGCSEQMENSKVSSWGRQGGVATGNQLEWGDVGGVDSLVARSFGKEALSPPSCCPT